MTINKLKASSRGKKYEDKVDKYPSLREVSNIIKKIASPNGKSSPYQQGILVADYFQNNNEGKEALAALKEINHPIFQSQGIRPNLPELEEIVELGADPEMILTNTILTTLRDPGCKDSAENKKYEKTRYLSSLYSMYTVKQLRSFGLKIDNNAWSRARHHAIRCAKNRELPGSSIDDKLKNKWVARTPQPNKRKQKSKLIKMAVKNFFNLSHVTEDSSKSMMIQTEEGITVEQPIKKLIFGNKHQCYMEYLMKSESDGLTYPHIAKGTFYNYIPEYVKVMNNRTDMCPMCVQLESLQRKSNLNQSDKKLIETLKVHKFFVHTMRNEFIFQKNNLKKDECIILMDYKENISLGQSETQVSNQYYNKPSRTFFGLVLFYVKNNKLITQHYDCLSQVLNHCSTMAISCIQKLLGDNIFQSLKIKKIRFWSDNAKHFKSNEMLTFFANLFSSRTYDIVEFNTFAPYHGKSECDQHFSMVSRAIDNASKFSSVYNEQDVIDAIQKATETNNFLRTHRLETEEEKEGATQNVIVNIHNPESLKQSDIIIFPGFTEFHHFNFKQNSLFCDKHYVRFFGKDLTDKQVQYIYVKLKKQKGVETKIHLGFEAKSQEDCQKWEYKKSKTHSVYLDTLLAVEKALVSKQTGSTSIEEDLIKFKIIEPISGSHATSRTLGTTTTSTSQPSSVGKSKRGSRGKKNKNKNNPTQQLVPTIVDTIDDNNHFINVNNNDNSNNNNNICNQNQLDNNSSNISNINSCNQSDNNNSNISTEYNNKKRQREEELNIITSPTINNNKIIKSANDEPISNNDNNIVISIEIDSSMDYQQCNLMQQFQQITENQQIINNQSEDVEMTDCSDYYENCIDYSQVKDLNTAEEDQEMNDAGDFLSKVSQTVRAMLFKIPSINIISQFGELFMELINKNPFSNLVFKPILNILGGPIG